MSLSAIQGGAYTSKLYFNPDAKKGSTVEGYLITQEELLGKLKTLIDVSDEILRVGYYTHPLDSRQLTNAVFYHAFLVFRTQNWYWSLEKDMEGLVIQRARELSNVRDYKRGKERTTGKTSFTEIQLVKEGRVKGNGSIRGLIYTLWKKELLLKTYHLATSNCQIFADEVFKIIEELNRDVYFDPNADAPLKADMDVFITVDEFLTEVKELCNRPGEPEEYLTRISVFSAPYETNLYVSFDTSNGYFWSLEKQFTFYDQLIIQRAKDAKVLHEQCKREERDKANPKIVPNDSVCLKSTNVDKAWTLNRFVKLMLSINQSKKKDEFALELYRKCENKPTPEFY